MLLLAIALACRNDDDTALDTQPDSDVVIVDAPVVDVPTTENVELAGYVLHQVVWRNQIEFFGTWSVASFNQPAAFELPATEFSPEQCSAGGARVEWPGDLDVGGDLSLSVGPDALRLTRDLDFEDGKILYLRDGTDEAGTTPGALLSVSGVATSAKVPERLQLTDLEGQARNLLASGVLDLEWVPSTTERAFLTLTIRVGPGDGSPPRKLLCSLHDDGGARIDTGWRDAAGWKAEIDVDRVQRDRVSIPGIGTIEARTMTSSGIFLEDAR